MASFLRKPDDVDTAITNSDTHDIIRKIALNSFAQEHIESFDELCKTDINDIFENSYADMHRVVNYGVQKSKSSRSDGKKFATDITTVKIEPRFYNVKAHPPQMVQRDTGTTVPMMPSNARRNARNYMIPFTATFKCTLTATRENGQELKRECIIDDDFIMRVPCAERCDICPLNRMTYDTQIQMGENPIHPGGLFDLINEWIVRHQEGLQSNELRVFNNEYEGEMTRGEIIAKLNNSNRNSAHAVIRMMDTDELTININHVPFSGYNFPFFVMFRLLGADTHKQMVDSILLGDYESQKSMYIQAFLKKCFFVKYKQFPKVSHYMSLDELKNMIITTMGANFLGKASIDIYRKHKNAWYIDLMNKIDKHFLPLAGTSPCDREKKWKLLGWCIRYILYVNMGAYPETDRDSEISKINERSGKRIVKMFKTFINSTIANPLLNAYQHALEHVPFESVDIKEVHDNALNTAKLEKMFIKLIAGGTKKSIKLGNRGQMITNRLNTIQRTGGHLATLCTLRQIVATTLSATSKQSVREHEMRMPHQTSIGFKCEVRTQENENVGKTKEMTVGSHICSDVSIPVFLNVLEQEYDAGNIIRNPSYSEIHERNLTQVSINSIGYIVGWTDKPKWLADKYRYLRRTGEISKMISIYWKYESDMLIFSCHGERSVRIIIPVYNNYGDSYTKQFYTNKGDFSDFVQWPAMRKSHIDGLRSGKYNIDDLINLGVLEYISADEQSTIHIAKSLSFLDENINNPIFAFNYVEIPVSVYSLSALMSINQNMNQGTRNTYATNHCQQAAGHYAINWRHRKDKGIALHQYNELPIITSIGNSLSITTGINFTVDIILDPYNQEDAQSHSLAMRDSGKCLVHSFDVISTNLGNDEEFKLPPVSNSTRRRNINYTSVRESTGLPDKYTMLKKNDVVIAKVYKKVNKQAGTTTYVDRSIRYAKDEDALVIDTIDYRNEDDVPTRDVIVAKMRLPEESDKYSSRHAQKGVVGIQYAPNDMYFDKDGRIASILFNPMSIPSRMTVAHMTEGTLSLLYAMKCISADGTIHTDLNINDIPKMLEAAGLHPDGTSILMNPTTGVVLSTRIYRGIIHYMDLQKYVMDKRYASASGATDIITRQPLEGKSVDGGLRFGEMERDAALAIGATKFISEKNYYHSNPATIYVCEKCGTVPCVNPSYGVSCKMCLDKTQVYAIDTTWSSWVFMNEMQAMFGMRIETKDLDFDAAAKKVNFN